MKHLLSHFLYAATALIVCLLCSVHAQTTDLTTTPNNTVIIISTADIHGNISQFPKLATLVKQYRAKYPHVFLVDSGDCFAGNPYVDEHRERHNPMTVLMNKVGYDVITIGDNDLAYGQEFLRNHLQGLPHTKVVLTNMVPNGSLLGYFSSYVSVPIGKTKASLGFMGLTNFQTTDKRQMGDLAWRIPQEASYRLIVDKFKLQNNTVNIILSHLGYPHDLLLTEYSPNLDLVFGAHTHMLLPRGYRMSGTLLSHVGDRLSHVGITKVVFSTKEPYNVLSKDTVAIALDKNIHDDPEIARIVQSIPQRPEWHEPIATATEDLTPFSTGNLFAQAVQRATGAEIVIYNRNNIRTKNTVAKGPITVQDVYMLEPYRDTVVTCFMSKQDIEQLILSRYLARADNELGVPGVACAGFTYQITTGEQPFITSSLENGKVYQVAMGDYLCSNFAFPQQGHGNPTDISVRQALIDYLKEQKTVKNSLPIMPTIVNNATISL